jgi:hypothetical protein
LDCSLSSLTHFISLSQSLSNPFQWLHKMLTP